MSKGPRRRTLRLTDDELARCDVLARRMRLHPDRVARAAFELGLGEIERSQGESVLGGAIGALADGVTALGKLREAAAFLRGRAPVAEETSEIVVRPRRVRP